MYELTYIVSDLIWNLPVLQRSDTVAIGLMVVDVICYNVYNVRIIQDNIQVHNYIFCC